VSTEPVWIEEAVAIAIHGEQLAEHGGLEGLRDRGLLESGGARPPHPAAERDPDLPALAAAYGVGIARNHPFVDGNKRTAFVVAELVLALNGLDLVADDQSCLVTMLAVAAGEMDEAAFADWLRKNIEETP
jgi:death-on-curing protein